MGRSSQEKCQYKKFLITAELMWLIPKYWMETSTKSNWMRTLLGIIYCSHTKLQADTMEGTPVCEEDVSQEGLKDWGGIRSLQGLASHCCRDRRAGKAVWGVCVPEQSRSCQADRASHAPRTPHCFSAFTSVRVSFVSPIPKLTFDTWSCLQLQLSHSSIQVLLILFFLPQWQKEKVIKPANVTYIHFTYTSHVFCKAFPTRSEAG